jgi:hypothetical protein
MFVKYTNATPVSKLTPAASVRQIYAMSVMAILNSVKSAKHGFVASAGPFNSVIVAVIFIARPVAILRANVVGYHRARTAAPVAILRANRARTAARPMINLPTVWVVTGITAQNAVTMPSSLFRLAAVVRDCAKYAEFHHATTKRTIHHVTTRRRNAEDATFVVKDIANVSKLYILVTTVKGPFARNAMK